MATPETRTRGKSRADRNRAIRQEALREQLARGKHLEHAVDCAVKLQDLTLELDQLQVTRLRAAMEGRLKLVAHYLPVLKAMELTGQDGGDLVVQVVKFAHADPLPPVPDDADDDPLA